MGAMKSRCCRSLPRCATCPVVLAARARAAEADGDLFALLRAAPQRDLPECVVDALEALDGRRFVRDDRLTRSV